MTARYLHGVEHGEQCSEGKANGKHAFHFDKWQISVTVLKSLLLSLYFSFLLPIYTVPMCFFLLLHCNKTNKYLVQELTTHTTSVSPPHWHQQGALTSLALSLHLRLELLVLFCAVHKEPSESWGMEKNVNFCPIKLKCIKEHVPCLMWALNIPREEQ